MVFCISFPPLVAGEIWLHAAAKSLFRKNRQPSKRRGGKYIAQNPELKIAAAGKGRKGKGRSGKTLSGSPLEPLPLYSDGEEVGSLVAAKGPTARRALERSKRKENLFQERWRFLRVFYPS